MKSFINDRSEGKSPDEETMAALDAAFRKIVDGASADDALDVRRPKKRPKSPETSAREVEIIWRMVELRTAGKSRAEAISDATIEYGINPEKAEELYRSYLSGNPSIPRKGQPVKGPPWIRYKPKPRRGGAK